MLALRRINFPVLLLSFALATLLWMHVKNITSVTSPTTGTSAFSVDLELRNQKPGTVIIGDVPSNVTFTAIAPLEEQRKININDLKAFVDLAEKSADGRYRVRLETTGDYEVRWQPSNLRIPIQIEDEVSRQIEVEVEAIGNFQLKDYRYDRATSDPRVISIRGAKSIVGKVKRARAYLNLSALGEDNSQKSKVELLDSQDSPILNVSLSTDIVTLRAIVAPQLPRRSLIIQPVWTGTPEFGTTIADYEISPKQISVEGPADVLANLQVLETKPINIQGIRDAATIQVELALPPGIHLTNREAVSVKIFVKKSGAPNPGNP